MFNISIQMTRLHAFDFTRGILTLVFFAPALKGVYIFDCIPF